MHYFIAYDITHDRLRRKVIKILERNGCVRVQKSVFLGGYIAPAHYREMLQQLQALLEKGEETDSVMFIPIEKDLLAQVGIIGDSREFRIAINNPNILLF